MSELASKTGELATLFVEEEARTVLLHQEQGDRSLELGMYPGMTFPIHSHTAGKVFLAYMDESRAREVLEAENLERQTEVTITDPDALRSVIERVRNDGCAFDWDQQVPGMGTIADPIIVDDTRRAVLAVGCPTSRLQNKTYRAKLRQKLQEKVDSITIRSQYGV